MKLKLLITCVAFLISLPSYSWELDEWNKTVKLVGSHAPSTGFVTLNEGVHANCIHQHLYFDISTNLGKSMFAILTTGKATQSKVRVGYTPPSTPGVCNLQLASLTD